MIPCSCAASSASAICLRDRQRLIDGDRPLRDAVGERRTLNQLQHERLHTIGILEPVDRCDVRMIEGREDFALRAGSEPADQDQRLAKAGRILIATSRFSFVSRRPIDLPHPAGPDGRVDLIRAEANAGRERQSVARLYGLCCSRAFNPRNIALPRRYPLSSLNHDWAALPPNVPLAIRTLPPKRAALSR